MHTLTKLVGAIACAGAAAITAAVPAAADADTVNELAYIMALDDEGISYSSEDAALAAGDAICDALEAGATVDMVLARGIAATKGFYSPGEVGYITGAAIAAFCPDEMPAQYRA